MNPTTINELDEWMKSNCYNNKYGIADRNINEGLGLDTAGSLFVWYYTERGERRNLDYFKTEQEAVEFAFKIITADKSANEHLVGFIKDRNKETELLLELEKREIKFWKDEIPYGGFNDPRIRVFVYGCDILKVRDLLEKYGSAE